MGHLVLVCRLAARDLRRRPGEAALLVLAIVATTATLTLGLLLHGVTNDPYDHTRAATAGPDVVANVTAAPTGGRADSRALRTLRRAPGVAASTGPYPLIEATAGAHGHQAAVQLEGRDRASARVDQPRLTEGTWVRPGGAVIERSFADAFGLAEGDQVMLGGKPFQILGVAVTAAMPPYPYAFCLSPCAVGGTPLPPAGGSPGVREPHPGLIWITRRDLRGLAPAPASIAYVLNLKLNHPSAAQDFVDRRSSAAPDAPSLEAWQSLSEDDANVIRNERRVLLTGSSLLTVLALASIAVLVGGRMSAQIRRVGLLRAVGATPRRIAAVLLAEYMFLALAAAVIGLALGRVVSPLLTSPGEGLLGGAGSVRLSGSTAGIVVAVALGVAAAATFLPAWRASRHSTVAALADAPRAARRTPWLIALSARLPVPLMLGLRVAARRPRRTALCAISVAVTVVGIVCVLAAHAQLSSRHVLASPGLTDPRADRLNQVLLVITLMLVALAAVNVLFITWATVHDTRRTSALERALGATPQEVSIGLAAAQVLPALAGTILGIPGGIALFDALSSDRPAHLAVGSEAAVLVATPLVIAALTAVPARVGGRRPAAGLLQSGVG